MREDLHGLVDSGHDQVMRDITDTGKQLPHRLFHFCNKSVLRYLRRRVAGDIIDSVAIDTVL